MGKTTLFHPVSLHVIRGALEVCGWKVGRLTQMHLSADQKSARYSCYLQHWPADIGPGPDNVKAALQECFATDITVTRVRMDSAHRLVATLETQLQPTSVD